MKPYICKGKGDAEHYRKRRLIQLLEHTPRNHPSRNETLHTRRSMSQKHVNTK